MTERVDLERRRVLLLLAGAPLAGATLAGCTTSRSGKLAFRQPHPDLDARVRLNAIRSERALLALHAETVDQHPDLADALEPLTTHHRQHVTALLDDGPLPLLGRPALGLPAGRPAETGDQLVELDLSTAETPEVPGTREAALDAVREAERSASEVHLADCLRATGTRLAALLASIAASEAAHDAGLTVA